MLAGRSIDAAAAYAQASTDGQFPALARQIYYAARLKILELTEKDTLDSAYFSYQLLPQFLQENFASST